MSPSRRQFMLTSMSAAVGASLARNDNAFAFADEAARDVPWLAEIQQPPIDPPANLPQLDALLIDAAGNPITTLESWRTRRAELRDWWLGFLGEMRIDRPEPTLQVIEEDRPGGDVVRQLVRWQSEPGIDVEAYLLQPAKLDPRKPRDPLPGVVVLHSTVNHTIRQPAGVEGDARQAFGLSLARAGCVCFCPKNFLWVGQGDYHARVAAFHSRHPDCKGMAKMLYDAQRGLDVLESLPQVDKQRLGAVGHSLGAKEALYLAAFDQRVKAAVSSEGGVGIRFSNWDAPWYLSDAVNADAFKQTGHEHHELLAMIAPRPFLLVGGDSADGRRSWPFIDAALPAYRLHEPRRRPRLGLFNHGQGHAVPPEAGRRIEEWLVSYL